MKLPSHIRQARIRDAAIDREKASASGLADVLRPSGPLTLAQGFRRLELMATLAGHQLSPTLAIDDEDPLYDVWQDQRRF